MDSTMMSVDFDMTDLEGTEYLDFMEDVENIADEHGVDVSGLWL